MGRRVEYQIVVVEANRSTLPSAADMVRVGVPLKVAREWQRVRHDMTVALRRRVAEDRN